MLTREHRLMGGEMLRALDDFSESQPVLSASRLAHLLGMHAKTTYAWIAAGRLDGAYRKRGKYNLIWRDRVLQLLCNEDGWNDHVDGTRLTARNRITTRERPLTVGEIRQACEGWESLITVQALAQLLDLKSVKTIYGWIECGHLKDSAQKPSKSYLIQRDRALQIIFNGCDWQSEK